MFCWRNLFCIKMIFFLNKEYNACVLSFETPPRIIFFWHATYKNKHVLSHIVSSTLYIIYILLLFENKMYMLIC